MFKVQNLTKKTSGKCLLDQVNFEVEEGQIAIFLGKSGVGKSTLLRTLNALETYDTGSFLLHNQPWSVQQLHKRHLVGMVFQQFNLFDHLNVEENITFALVKRKKKSKAEAREIAYKLLDRYELRDKATGSVQKLSGGQKQRLALARTLALEPKIICLDEPTSALDPDLTDQVAHSIQELAGEKRIVLLTTHDLSLLEKLKGTLFLMEEGAIVEKASSQNFAESPHAFPKLKKFLRIT